MASRPVQNESEGNITELIGRLTGDSKRLVQNEVRLAKLEIREGINSGTRGIVRLLISFGISVIAMVAFTVLLATVLARLTGKVWAGTLLAGLIEGAIGAWLVLKGTRVLKARSYTLGESREELRTTAAWVKETSS